MALTFNRSPSMATVQRAELLKLNKVFAFSVVTVAMLGGCGGGGISSPAQPQMAVNLTASNAVNAARVTSDTFTIFETATFLSQFVTIETGVLKNGTAYSCLESGIAASGSFTYSSTAAGKAIKPNDQIVVDFKNCQFDENYPDRLTGKVTLVMASTSGNVAGSADVLSPWAFTANAVFAKLSSVSPDGTDVLDGDMTISVAAGQAVNVRGNQVDTTKVSTAGLTIKNDVDTRKYINFTGSLMQDWIQGGLFEAAVNGTIYSDLLSGTVSIQTPNLFKGKLPNELPNQGAALIVGASGSSLTMQATPTAAVKLSLTSSGGVAQAISTSWTQIKTEN